MVRIIIYLIVALVIGFSGGCAIMHTRTPAIAGKTQVHWMKKGEKAPFDGILLSPETYGKLRTRIILLEQRGREK